MSGENKLGIGRISFPSTVENNLLLALEEFVRRVDDNVNYLLKPKVVTTTSTYTATDLDSTILCNGTFTVTLPDAATVEGKQLTVKNIGTGTVTVDGFGSQEIDGDTTEGLATQYQAIVLHSDGENWFKLATK
jgi:hypothetical protein